MKQQDFWLALRIVVYLLLFLAMLGLRWVFTWGDAAYRPGFFYDLVLQIEKAVVFVIFLPKVVVGYLVGCKEFNCDVSYIYPRIISLKVLGIRILSSFIFNIAFLYSVVLFIIYLVKKILISKIKTRT